MVKEPEEIKQMRENLKDLKKIHRLVCAMEDPQRRLSPWVDSFAGLAERSIEQAIVQQKAELQTASDKFWDDVYDKEQADANTK